MEQQVSGVVGSKSNRSGRGKWLLLGGLVIVVLAATAVYVSLNRNKVTGDEKLAASSVCNDDINKQAATYMNGDTSAVQYRQIVDSIKQKKDYDRDPNCLYIVISYNLDKNLSTGNDRYMSRLEKVYDPGKGFSPAFGNTLSLQGLRERVKQMDDINDSYYKEMDKMNQDDVDNLRKIENIDVPQQ